MVNNEFRKLVKSVLEGNEELLTKIFPTADTEVSSTGENVDNDESTAKTVTPTTTTTTSTAHHVADQDLLNNITRLEEQLKEQEKTFKRQIDNLEQQIEVWKEKNKKRVETEEELSNANESMKKLKAEMIEQQQLVNELVEEREKVNKDYQSVVFKVTEREKEIAQLQRMNDELTQRLNNLQRQLTTANQMRENLRKDTVELNRRIVALEQSEATLLKTLEEYKLYKINLAAVTENFELLQQQHRLIQSQLASTLHTNEQLRDQCKELDIVKQKLEQSEKKVQRLNQSFNDTQVASKKLAESYQVIQNQLDQYSSTLIHHFVESTIAHWASKITMQEFEATKKLAQQVPDLVDKLKEAEHQVSELQLRVKDTKTEYLLQIKKNQNMVKEMRSQLQLLQQQNEQLKQQAKEAQEKPSLNINSPPRFARGNSFHDVDSPKPRRSTAVTHTRTNSASSTGSFDGNNQPSTPVSGVSVTPSSIQLSSLQQQVDQLTKDNGLLLNRVSELQQTKWNMTERVRHLEESVMLLQEEIEKKQTIVQHYVTRERIGRIAPEQERWTNTIKRKQEQKLQPQTNTTINADAYKHMQQVMQETLLHNIQLQKDIRTLGEEISRLLKEVDAVKQKNSELQSQVDSSSAVN
jgi:chromosome segregation ATPase